MLLSGHEVAVATSLAVTRWVLIGVSTKRNLKTAKLRWVRGEVRPVINWSGDSKAIVYIYTILEIRRHFICNLKSLRLFEMKWSELLQTGVSNHRAAHCDCTS